jgi:hypothetical protein
VGFWASAALSSKQDDAAMEAGVDQWCGRPVTGRRPLKRGERGRRRTEDRKFRRGAMMSAGVGVVACFWETAGDRCGFCNGGGTSALPWC